MSAPLLRQSLWVLLPIACCGGLGCVTPDQPAASVTVWAVDEMFDLDVSTPAPVANDAFDAEGRTIRLAGGANETVAVQIVLDAGSGGLAGPDVRLGDFAGPDGRMIRADRAQLYRMWPVAIDEFPAWQLRLAEGPIEPRQVYDALTPLGAPGSPPLGPAVGGGQRRAIWLDVHIPRDAVAGEYVAPLTVAAGPAGRVAATCEVRLRVYPFVLPDHRPIRILAGFDHRDLAGAMLRAGDRPFRPEWLDRRDPDVRDLLVIIRQLMRLAHEHRVDLFDSAVAPQLKRDLTGRVELDWTDYDAIVGPYLDGTAFDDRLPVAAWPMPIRPDWPDPANYGGVDAPGFQATVIDLARQSTEHFAELGHGEKLFTWPMRQAPRGPMYEPMATWGRLIRSGDADATILSHLPLIPPAETGWDVPQNVGAATDMLAPPGPMLRPDQAGILAVEDNPLAGLYYWPTEPPYGPTLHPAGRGASLRAMPWLVRSFDLAGIFVPDALQWSHQPPDGFTPTEGLFYPGRFLGLDQVLPSVRLKRLRRGLQDQAYLWLLQQRSRATIAQTLADSMARYIGLAATGDHYLDPRLHGWVDDPDAWRLTHQLLMLELQAALGDDPATQQELLSLRLNWRRLEEATRGVLIERLIGQAVPDPDQPDRLVVTVRAELLNTLSREAQVRLTPQLPLAETTVVAGAEPITMAPGESRTIRLTIHTPAIPAGSGGKYRLGLSLDVDGQLPRLVAAPVGLLLSRPVDAPPRIDGRLDDWPLRAGNRAGEFGLLGRRGLRGQRPAQPTWAWVTHDRDNLYVVIRCDRDPGEPLRAEPTNQIDYDQLLLSGQDLVELILDPGADAAGAADLYHLIVKANGVLVAERGVASDPPLGASEPWATTTRVAIGRTESFWMAELAIPLSQFGLEGSARVWGINIARFDAAAHEPSSWAEPSRYYYHPGATGTLLLLDAQAGAGPGSRE